MINKILLSLYDYYRRKNDPLSAVFHSKALLSVFVLMITFILLFGSFALFGKRMEVQLDGNSLKLVLIGVMIVIMSLLWFLTDSDKILDSKRNYAEVAHRRLFFICFYLAIPFLIYFIVFIRR